MNVLSRLCFIISNSVDFAQSTVWSYFQVVYNVGLCICLYDIVKLEDSYIFPGDGASHTKGNWSVAYWFMNSI